MPAMPHAPVVSSRGQDGTRAHAEPCLRRCNGSGMDRRLWVTVPVCVYLVCVRDHNANWNPTHSRRPCKQAQLRHRDHRLPHTARQTNPQSATGVKTPPPPPLSLLKASANYSSCNHGFVFSSLHVYQKRGRVVTNREQNTNWCVFLFKKRDLAGISTIREIHHGVYANFHKPLGKRRTTANKQNKTKNLVRFQGFFLFHLFQKRKQIRWYFSFRNK